VRAGGIVFVDGYQLPAVAKATSFFVKNLDGRLEEMSAADELHHSAVAANLARPGQLRGCSMTSSSPERGGF
jgi:hypothetical protein